MDKETILNKAIAEGIIDPSDNPLVMFMDLDHLTQQFSSLQKAFPPNTLHAVACKANPVYTVLEIAQKMGMGCEVASLGELTLAMGIFDPEMIVYDSPCKTIKELRYAMQNRVWINADSLQEIERIASLQEEVPSDRIGIRINPQVGAGTILATSTAIPTSKFGLALTEHREEIVRVYTEYEWITGMHLHIGSQGINLELLVKGARIVTDLILEINQRRTEKDMKPISVVDIGGGISVNYSSDEYNDNFQVYANTLREQVPELFQDGITLITEFGRSLSTKAGWTASVVEYTKQAGSQEIAIIHAGADLFVRTCLLPEQWPLRVTVCLPSGNFKISDDSNLYDIAGPLCFSGDLVARNIRLPHIEPGDYVMIHDTGAYTLGLWSRYNSRTKPPVIGYKSKAGSHQWKTLLEKETMEDLIRFWK
eukprot:TRINITY_DN5393_c0_g1_i1.p1 TRINITY_DN5393_c0_g1~~TRINITY_DN5393_c0_g1_i1.p1  ORF type:complete len:423 (+),score=92.55 TRINITY_DN5393_c0_g1_i1:193-1461(+)